MSAHAAADAWTALLVHAMHLAKASRAWGGSEHGERMRESVSPLVQLHAVTIAMGQLEGLAPPHRAYARDQADVLLRRACESLRATWSGEPMPDPVLQAMSDSRQAIANALYAGLRCLRWPGLGSLVVPAWPASASEVRGSLALMEAGTIALAGEVVAWWCDREPLACDGCVTEPLDAPVQVYRRFDAAGRFERAVTIPLHEELPAGMPMLVPLCVAGEPVGVFMRDPAAWLAVQRAAGIPGS
jgi:hypothetical protein